MKINNILNNFQDERQKNYKKLNDDFDQHSKDLEKQGENKKLTNLF